MLCGTSNSFPRRVGLQRDIINTTSRNRARAANNPVKMASTITSLSRKKEINNHSTFLQKRMVQQRRKSKLGLTSHVHAIYKFKAGWTEGGTLSSILPPPLSQYDTKR